jgi:hypothetical protein
MKEKKNRDRSSQFLFLLFLLVLQIAAIFLFNQMALVLATAVILAVLGALVFSYWFFWSVIFVVLISLVPVFLFFENEKLADITSLVFYVYLVLGLFDMFFFKKLISKLILVKRGKEK